MRYKLRCLKCGATVWADVEEDLDTNSFEIKRCDWGDDPRTCDHEDFEVIDSEYSDNDMGVS